MSAPPPTGPDLPRACPSCGQRALSLSWILAATPIAAHSLAGAQVKVSAQIRATVRCPCTWAVQGRLEGATVSADGSRLRGGHFVADPAAPSS